MNKPFKVSEVFLYGWNRFKANWRVLVGSTVAAYLVNLLIQIVTKEGHDLAPAQIGMGIVSIAFGLVVAYAAVRIGLLEGKGVKAGWKDLFPETPMIYVKMVGTGALVFLMFGVVAGLAAILMAAFGHGQAGGPLSAVVIVAAFLAVVYLSVKTRFAFYFLVEGSGVVESIKKSFKVVEGSFWLVLGLLFVIAVLNIAGAIAFVVGLLVTVPFTMVMMGNAYHKLAEHRSRHGAHSA